MLFRSPSFPRKRESIDYPGRKIRQQLTDGVARAATVARDERTKAGGLQANPYIRSQLSRRTKKVGLPPGRLSSGGQLTSCPLANQGRTPHVESDGIVPYYPLWSVYSGTRKHRRSGGPAGAFESLEAHPVPEKLPAQPM